MKLDYKDKSILFSTTEIPDIFFTEYLSCASGDFIKIYLCLVFLSKYDKDIKITDLSKKLLSTLGKAQKDAARPTVGDVADRIQGLYGSLSGLTKDKQILDRFVSARVGDKSGTYIANQWTRVCDKLIKSSNDLFT